MRRALLFTALSVLLLQSNAQAQDAQGNTFNLQLFRPAMDSKGYFSVNASQILGHLDFSLGFVASWARNTLQLINDVNKTSFTVSDFTTAQVQAALGLFKWVEIGVSLPVHILFGRRDPAYRSTALNQDNDLTFGAQFIGDIGLHPKVRLLNTSKYPVGLALIASIYAPTGKSNSFLGEGNVSLHPELVLDKEFGFSRRVRMALNVGALVRFNHNTFTDRGTVLKGDPTMAMGGPFCAPSPGVPDAPPGSCGTGLSRSLGTQVTYGLGFSGSVVPQKLELLLEVFGYADVTGSAKGFPLEFLAGAKVYLAAKSYFQFGAGTGLIPGQTGSPQPRVFVGFIFEPSIGDRDGDGIKDDVDKCPDEPEDRDDFEDEDGCPDPDNDKDGILDHDDACPNEPGPLSNHGCPVLDRDKDGVADIDDECPTVPGPADNRGCPPLALTRLRGGKLLILKPIFFETNKAIIKPVSFPTLNEVAETLQSNEQLTLIEIQGHADERGDDDYNLRLTDERAASVKRYLIERGVAQSRLRSRGYGETHPVCFEHTDECWSQNRRVEFIIVERSDVPKP